LCALSTHRLADSGRLHHRFINLGGWAAVCLTDHFVSLGATPPLRTLPTCYFVDSDDWFAASPTTLLSHQDHSEECCQEFLDPQPHYANQLEVWDCMEDTINFLRLQGKIFRKQNLDLQADCFSSQLEARGLMGDGYPMGPNEAYYLHGPEADRLTWV
jgi:hypothetical protein